MPIRYCCNISVHFSGPCVFLMTQLFMNLLQENSQREVVSGVWVPTTYHSHVVIFVWCWARILQISVRQSTTGGVRCNYHKRLCNLTHNYTHYLFSATNYKLIELLAALAWRSVFLSTYYILLVLYKRYIVKQNTIKSLKCSGETDKISH